MAPAARTVPGAGTFRSVAGAAALPTVWAAELPWPHGQLLITTCRTIAPCVAPATSNDWTSLDHDHHEWIVIRNCSTETAFEPRPSTSGTEVGTVGTLAFSANPHNLGTGLNTLNLWWAHPHPLGTSSQCMLGKDVARHNMPQPPNNMMHSARSTQK